jgi:hypothetical protein
VTQATLSDGHRESKTEHMEDQLSVNEIRKDALQETAQSVAATVGEVAAIITTAVKDVFGAIGGLATDVFEIREGVRRAQDRADATMD